MQDGGLARENPTARRNILSRNTVLSLERTYIGAVALHGLQLMPSMHGLMKRNIIRTRQTPARRVKFAATTRKLYGGIQEGSAALVLCATVEMFL